MVHPIAGRKKLRAKIMCNRTKSSLSREINKSDGNLLKASWVLWWFIIKKSHEKNYEDSQDIRFFVWSPKTASKSSWIPENLMPSKGWLYTFFREDRRRWHLSNIFRLPPVKTFCLQAYLLLYVKWAEKSTHDSIVRLCCTRDCLHAKKTRSNSFGIQAILHSWMEIYFFCFPEGTWL